MLAFGVVGLLIRILAGLIIGFCIGLTGVGGGVLVVPTLTLLFKLPPSTAVGTASLYAFLSNIAATFHHYKLKTVATPTAAWFLTGAIPANIAVAALITMTVKRLGSESDVVNRFQGNLKLFIAYVILFSCVMLIINMTVGLRNRRQENKQGRLATAITSCPVVARYVSAGLGTIVGALIGATSVGGGVIILPMLIFFLGMTSSRTVGTSRLIAVVLTLVTSAIYLVGGEVAFWTAISMAVGSMVGVPLGSKLSVRLPENVLKAVVIAVIVVAAILMLSGNGGH